MQPFETLISVSALMGRLHECVLLDCRASLSDPGAGRAAHAAGHLPGAVHADLDRDLAAPHQPGKTGRHPLPDPDQLAARFRAWGIGNDTQIVAYDADSGALAARAWWLARWLGHSAAAVLDGGLAAWCAAGGALTSTSSQPRPGAFSRRPALVTVVTVNDIERGGLTLLDARSVARFAGEVEPIDPVAGHIPGARSMPFEDNLSEDRRFKDARALAALFDGVTPGPNGIAAYCGSGVTACHLVLAMRQAGLPAPGLYVGSWSEWIVDPQRPVATGR